MKTQTSFGLIQEKHVLDVGAGILLLNVSSNYSTTDVNDEELKPGGDEWFPMPLLSISGWLKFNNIRDTGTGGGAIFKGEKDSIDFNGNPIFMVWRTKLEQKHFTFN